MDGVSQRVVVREERGQVNGEGGIIFQLRLSGDTCPDNGGNRVGPECDRGRVEKIAGAVVRGPEEDLECPAQGRLVGDRDLAGGTDGKRPAGVAGVGGVDGVSERVAIPVGRSDRADHGAVVVRGKVTNVGVVEDRGVVDGVHRDGEGLGDGVDAAVGRSTVVGDSHGDDRRAMGKWHGRVLEGTSRTRASDADRGDQGGIARSGRDRGDRLAGFVGRAGRDSGDRDCLLARFFVNRGRVGDVVQRRGVVDGRDVDRHRRRHRAEAGVIRLEVELGKGRTVGVQGRGVSQRRDLSHRNRHAVRHRHRAGALVHGQRVTAGEIQVAHRDRHQIVIFRVGEQEVRRRECLGRLLKRRHAAGLGDRGEVDGKVGIVERKPGG